MSIFDPLFNQYEDDSEIPRSVIIEYYGKFRDGCSIDFKLTPSEEQIMLDRMSDADFLAHIEDALRIRVKPKKVLPYVMARLRKIVAREK